jgi:hypothetical protein
MGVMGACRFFRTGRLAVLSCALVCAFLLCSASALASRGHAFSGAFGEPCSTGPCGEGKLKEPAGVAINEQSGEVYVLDRGDGLIERFSSAGAYAGQFSGSETPAKAFGFVLSEERGEEGSFAGGIAVDNSCYSKGLSREACAKEDPSNGDVYVADPEHRVVDKFSPEGAYIGQLQQASGGGAFEFTKLDGVDVDTAGVVWVYYNAEINGDAASFTDREASTYISTLSLGLGHGFSAPGFAVDSEDNLYVRRRNGGHFIVVKRNHQQVASGEEELLSEEETSAVAVDAASNEVFLDNVGSVGAFDAGGNLLERFGSGELVGGSGLAVSHASGSVYVADSVVGVVDVFGPAPPSRPTVARESVSDVGGTSATFGAEVNPDGAETVYHFEYGRCVSAATCASDEYGESAPVPDATLGAGFEVEGAGVHPQDLLAGTEYHFRVVATNEFGTVDGPNQTFTTQVAAVGGSLLADGRQWELVSPPSKQGASIAPPGGGAFNAAGPIQAAEGGRGIVYETNVPTELEPPGYGQLKGADQVLSVRGVEGWSTRDIATPHTSATRLTIVPEYQIFSGDLSSGMAAPVGKDQTLLSSEASEPTPYLRREALCDTRASAGECYLPLVTGKEGFADVPPGTQFGGSNFATTGANPAVTFKGASPDLQHVLLKSRVALTATPIPPPETTSAHGAVSELYEWSAGVPRAQALQLVSVLPANEGGGPSAALVVGVGTGAGQDLAEGSRHAVSDDGTRVFWETGSQFDGDARALYMRDTARHETVRLDVQQPGAPSGGTPEARFEVASADGSRVIFSDGQRLTSDSGSQVGGPDLYECQIVEEAGKLGCRLSDLTPERSGRSAELQDMLSGASEDGSYLYFVANGVLSENKNSNGESATQGTCSSQGEKPNKTCNLYEYHDGGMTFIATLAMRDQLDWGLEVTYVRSVGNLTAYASPDGRYFTFASERSLTGYDNRDALSGKPDSEVYLFDASTGRLACVSCNPTGARPAGLQAGEFFQGGAKTSLHSENVAGVFRDQFNEVETRWIAANLPTGVELQRGEGVYQPRALSDGGRVFLNSSDALVPQDVNGNEDVYEFEPEGLGSCTVSSATFSAKSGGCVSLVSSGTSPVDSGFMDASAGGGDVFFMTNARLTAQDYDASRDVYDAHVCTPSAPCISQAASVPPCDSGDACKGAPLPQPAAFGAPASATFAGAGNVVASSPSGPGVRAKSLTRAQKLARALRACKKQPRRKRAACVRGAQKRYAAKRASVKRTRGVVGTMRKVQG